MPELKTQPKTEASDTEVKNSEDDELGQYDSIEELRFWNWLRRNLRDKDQKRQL